MRSPRASVSVFVVVVGLLVLAVPGGAAATNRPSAGGMPVSTSVDLSSALAADGTFVGARDVEGSVDISAWTLTSDVLAGGAPRFAPAATAALTPGQWNALGSTPPNSSVNAIAVSGSNIYIGGAFYQSAGLPPAADFVAKWNGSSWEALASDQNGAAPINGPVYSLLVSGSSLYVGGSFFNAGGDSAADYLALWNGSSWSDVQSLAAGTVGPVQGQVHALVLDGGRLFVGGYFFDAGGNTAADMITYLESGTWHNLGGTGLPGNGLVNGMVEAIAVSGNDVYVGGQFANVAGNMAIDYIGRFNIDEFVWHSLDDFGGNGSLNSYVHALLLVGTNLYVGGEFTTVDGMTGVDNLARWTGLGWSQVMNPSPNGAVRTIVISNANIYVGGNFTNAGGDVTADYVARWNTNKFSWFPLGSYAGNGALNAQVSALAMVSDALYVGGNFTNAGNIAAADCIAAWGLGSGASRKPDGRIKKGSGSLVGNNIYNTTGLNQIRQGTAAIGSTITFTVSIQNDGSVTDKFKVSHTVIGSADYQVTYWHGTTDITSAVVAGTYETTNLAPGGKYAIKAKVKVLNSALAGSSTTRLVTSTSVGDPSKQDTVKFIVKRA